MFITCGEDIKLHCIKGTELQSCQIYIPQNEDKIVQVSWCKDEKYIVFVNTSGMAQIFSMEQLRVFCKIEIDNVVFATFGKSSKRYIGLTTTGGCVSIFDTRKRIVRKVFTTADGTVIPQLDYTFDDQQFCGYAEDFLLIFYSEELKRIQQLGRCTSLRCHPRLNQVVIGCENGYLMSWDTMTCQNIFKIHAVENAISGILIIENCFILSSENMLKLCREDTKRTRFAVQDLNFESNEITSMDFYAKDKLLAIGLADGCIKVYNHNDNMLLTILKVHETAVNKVSFSNNGDMVDVLSTALESLRGKDMEVSSANPAGGGSVDERKAEDVEIVEQIEQVEDNREDNAGTNEELRKQILDDIKEKHLMSCKRDVKRIDSLLRKQMSEFELGFEAEIQHFAEVCEAHKRRFLKKLEQEDGPRKND